MFGNEAVARLRRNLKVPDVALTTCNHTRDTAGNPAPSCANLNATTYIDGAAFFDAPKPRQEFCG
jgi:hypothetical protein